MLISRGCTTESKFYISIYITVRIKENKFFSQINFLEFLIGLPSKNVHFHVKVIYKKFGDILLIFRGCTTESKFYIFIYITVTIKEI